MSRACLILSLIILAFGYGFLVSQKQLFPYMIIRDGSETFKALFSKSDAVDAPADLLGLSNVPLAELPRGRLRLVRGARKDSAAENTRLLVVGGAGRFKEHCGGIGCLAVVMDLNGVITQAYPYLPEEIYAANIAEGYPYEYISFDPVRMMRPIGVERYRNGDLLVTFQGVTHMGNLFPYGAGLARVGPDGWPRWFRFDYTHHWSTLLPTEEALVPGLAIGKASVNVKLASDHTITLRCNSERPLLDTLRVVTSAGEISREFSMLDAFFKSPFRGVLQQTSDPCDPLHLNFIDRIGEDSAGLIKDGVPGDYIASFRNISSLAIVDHQSGKIKRLIRGGFVQQHSVHHLTRSKIILFDNAGADYDGGPSRLLELDLANGRERTIFPKNDFAGDKTGTFSSDGGFLDLSEDRKRAIVTFSNAGKAYEVRLQDGRVLWEFVNVHDLSDRIDLEPAYSYQAASFKLFGINYIPIRRGG